MSDSTAIRRAMAELDFGEGNTAVFRVGNRSIHQFWHLFAAHFRHVLLAPQRRPDSGRVAWTWREATEKQPVTVTELIEVRRRLTEAKRSLTSGFGGLGSDDDSPGGASDLERQVRVTVGEMVEQLVEQRDFVLAGFVCRTEAGLMLHSWGAATAAEPYYPDTQSGEISGAVFAGAERLAGIKVVLENAQGHGVAQVSSDRDGCFRFPNLAPGDYRVRVADRSDFPANGLGIKLERDSVAGLELRGTPLGDSPPVAVTPVPADRMPPWYQRRRVTLIASLGVIALGSCVWRSMRPPADEASSRQAAAGWQSASNQVAASAAKESATNDRKVGVGGAWSSLSRSLADPKTPPHRPSPARSMGKENESDRPAAPADDASSLGSDRVEPKNAESASSAKVGPSRGVPAEAKANVTRAAAPATTGENTGDDGEPDKSGQPDEESKPAADKQANMLPPEVEKKRPPRPSHGASSDEEPSEAAPAAAQFEVASDSSASATAAKGGQSAQATTARNQPVSSTGTAPASVAGSPSESPTQNAGAAVGSAASANQAKPSSGDRSKEKNNGLAAQASDAAVAASGDLAAVTGAQSEAPASDSSPNNRASKSKRDQQAASASTASGVAPAAEAKSSPEEAAADPAVASRTKGAKKTGVVSPAEESSSLSSETRLSPITVADGLVVFGRVRASVWRPRLIRDRILPTTPLTAAEEEALDAMREKLLQEWAAQMPAAFRQPRMTSGFVLEVPRAATDDGRLLRWRDLAGAEPAGATVQGNRAELGWSGALPFGKGDFVLSDEAGRELARVNVDHSGVPSLKGGSGLRAWYWVGIEGAADEITVTNGAGEARFDWRLLSGAALPASWVRHDHWRGGRGWRIDIPLDRTTARVGNYNIGLVDPNTGWALAGSIAVQ